ncbi:MAG: SDR family NAD(P)-dependent oxidoreductase [Anaerolineae bacterium]|nr:SDR family NAD(P)-dependent oxidoreductase [Anaerolineae bacterium]
MPKKLNEQVIVITGATSGIGRATALEAAKRGARVVIAARDDLTLAELRDQIEAIGGSAFMFRTDVGVYAQVEELAKHAREHFGRIDTWVNNAGLAVYGTVNETPVEDIETLIETNLMGVIYGIKAVLPILVAQGEGTIINVGSALSNRAVPLQAAYSAAKHGVRGFTEALRMELEYEHPGVKVTLVMPASMDTPFFRNARSNMPVEPQPVPPVYDPKLVADAILSAAENPQRDILVGDAARFLTYLQKLSPRLLDFFMVQNGRMFKQQQSFMRNRGGDNLDTPMRSTDTVKGGWAHMTIPATIWEQIRNNPVLQRLVYMGTMSVLGLIGRQLGIRRNATSRRR